MGRSKFSFRNPSVGRCTFFVAGLLALVNLTIVFCWLLEQPTRQKLLNYLSLYSLKKIVKLTLPEQESWFNNVQQHLIICWP
jgi:hypothetical protein